MIEVAIAEISTHDSSNVRLPRRLWILLAAHLVLPLVASLLARKGFGDEIMFGVIVYQLLLLSVWAGLSSSGLGVRCLFFFFGTASITATLVIAMRIAYGPHNDPDFSFVSTVGAITLLNLSVSGLCTICLLFVRPRLLRLQRVPDPMMVDRDYRSALSIRHLFVVTFLCAVVIALTRAPLMEIRPPLLVAVAMLLAPVAAAMFALTWAILAPRSPWMRVALALCANVGAAALMIVQFDYRVESMIAMLPGLFVFVISLLVLRGAGYRLMRPAASDAEGERPENDE